MSAIIKIPCSLTPSELLPFSIALRLTIADSYILDFSDVRLTEPFGMLFLAAIIRQFIREKRSLQGRDCEITVRNYQNQTYASFMGLFKSFGLDHGNEPGAACGSGTYIPLTRLPVSRLTKDARVDLTRVQDVIEHETERIARVLTRNSDGPITKTLHYAIREVMRNVVEHGCASHIWYAAQYWPTKNKVEVAVLDEGCGLLASLKRNRKLTVENDQEAVELALAPGVSSVEKPDRRIDGDWANSGYGLYMTSSLCERAGEFLLCNYSKALSIIGAEQSWQDCSFNGVAVRMVIDTRKIDDLNKTLQELRRNIAK